jgi:hypothetical protein
LIPPRPPSSSSVARAGIADPETATEAVAMRRTGKLEAASLSFHNSRLEQAAKKLGVTRPGSGKAGEKEPSTRFHWKLKTRRHSLEEEATKQQKDPSSLD